MPKPDSLYQEFIQTVLQHQQVYTLQKFNGEFDEVATCDSAVHQNDYDEPLPVYCFWHTEAAARVCQTDEWADYQLTSAPLSDFICDALINMDEDEILVGIAFDEQLYGMEIEPMELLSDLLDTTMAENIALQLPNPEEIIAYRMAWEKQIAGQTQLH